MKSNIFIMLFGIVIRTSCANKNVKDENVKDFQKHEKVQLEVKDSISLKNGAILKYVTDSKEQFLLLEKNGRLIDTLASTSVGLDVKNLGYLVQDYEETFLFAQSFGSGNAHNIYLIDKATGQNKLGDDYYYFIDLDTLSQTLLYSKSDVPSIDDTLFSINPVTGKKIYFEFPQIVLSEEEILNRIHISKVNGSEQIVDVEYENWKKKKQIKLINR